MEDVVNIQISVNVPFSLEIWISLANEEFEYARLHCFIRLYARMLIL